MIGLNENEEAKFGHCFNLIPGIGACGLKNIFNSFNGSFFAAFSASPSVLLQKIKNPRLVDLILKNRNEINPDKEWQKIVSRGISAITINDPDYPLLLKEIYVPPHILYFKGDIKDLNDGYSTAIVGTRRASFYGLETSLKLSRELALAGINIISGLALGIDSKAHWGAVEAKGKTFAVLGSGVSNILPRTNLFLSDKIIEGGGAVLSEYLPDMPAEKWTFPERNRIIAGLALLTIVVEAPEKSGALITAKFALDANRDVGVVPGEISSIVSKGSNELLKHGAHPILSTRDALEIFGILDSAESNDFFDDGEKKILSHIADFISSEELFLKTGMDIKEFNQKISALEIKGAIRSAGGGFERIKKSLY